MLDDIRRLVEIAADMMAEDGTPLVTIRRCHCGCDKMVSEPNHEGYTDLFAALPAARAALEKVENTWGPGEVALLEVKALELRRDLMAVEQEARNAGLEEAARAIPTNWVDPLLTGPDAALRGENDCRDIERLLRTIQDRIRALRRTTPADAGEENRK